MPESLADLADLAAIGVNRVLVPVTAMAGMATAIADPEQALEWRENIERYADV